MYTYARGTSRHTAIHPKTTLTPQQPPQKQLLQALPHGAPQVPGGRDRGRGPADGGGGENLPQSAHEAPLRVFDAGLLLPAVRAYGRKGGRGG